MKLFARKRLYFLFKKDGKLEKVFLNKPKKIKHNWTIHNRLWADNYWTDASGIFHGVSQGDKLQLWVLVGRKYEFAKEYK